METLTIFSDASFCAGTKAAGGAFWAKDGKGRYSLAYAFEGALTSSEAEIMAVCYSVQALVKEPELATFFALGEQARIVFNVDCLDVFHAIGRWLVRDHGLKTLALLARLKKFQEMLGFQIEVKHVKAHTGGASPDQMVNDWCDRSAKFHMRGLRNKLHTGGSKSKHTLGKSVSKAHANNNAVPKQNSAVKVVEAAVEPSVASFALGTPSQKAHVFNAQPVLTDKEQEQLLATYPDIPAVGAPWPSQGGVYLGVTRSTSGRALCHLVAAYGDIEDVAWHPTDKEALSTNTVDGQGNTRYLKSLSKKSAAAKVSQLDWMGFNDWYVPAHKELLQVLALNGKNMSKTAQYLSSDSPHKEECLHFTTSLVGTLHSKKSLARVRPVRQVALEPVVKPSQVVRPAQSVERETTAPVVVQQNRIAELSHNGFMFVGSGHVEGNRTLH